MNYVCCHFFLDGKNHNVHCVNKARFLSNNAQMVDTWEKVMVFITSPSYVEVVKRVRNVLNWMNPSEQVGLEGRYVLGPDLYL